MDKYYYVYIMASGKNGTLYIGVTSDLVKRVYQHKNHHFDGFSKKYDVDRLVYYEIFEDIERAIKKEKLLKEWHRNWKKDLIEGINPEWNDLWKEITK